VEQQPPVKPTSVGKTFEHIELELQMQRKEKKLEELYE
jgi:hypothetical protein